jgi:hypothetical protein
MVKLTAIGTSVEALSFGLQTRKFLPRIPERDATINAVVYPFKLSIFGKVRINKELEPKKAIWLASSRLDLGDELHGEAINGRCEKPLGRPSIEHATGTHRASVLSTRGRSFAQIEIGIRALLQQKQLPAPKKP